VPYEPPDWLAHAVSTFGRSAREQLSTGAGEPEEALRARLVSLVKEIGSRHGLQVVPGSAAPIPPPADRVRTSRCHLISGR
jgi:hypothetical protein